MHAFAHFQEKKTITRIVNISHSRIPVKKKQIEYSLQKVVTALVVLFMQEK